MQLWKRESLNFLETATPRQKVTAGTIMWLAFYLGYFTFCLNWLMFSHVKGELSSSNGDGWLSYFKDRGLGSDKETIGIKSDAVNYSITLVRGIAAIAAGWVMTKLSHKRASIIALALNTMALPLIFAPRYELLVIGRMMMAAGGTMLIILIQPVIASFFNLKAKGILSTLTSTAYILAAIFAHLLFVYEGTNKDFINWFLKNWRLVTGICAGLSYIPLILYIVYGKHFVAEEKKTTPIEGKNKIFSPNTYAGVIKERKTWLWVVLYSFLLVASLLVSLKVPHLIKKVNKSLIDDTLKNIGLSWSMVYNCSFYFGCLVGMVWGRWAKTQYQRKPIINFCSTMSFVCWLLILVGMHLQDKVAGSAICFFFAFFFAFFAMGIQPVMLYVPHEYEENKNNSKRLTIFFAYLWGIGYILFTIYQIIVVSCLDIGGEQNTTGSYIGIGLITLFILMFAVLSLFVKESRPYYKFFPGLNKFSDLIHRERLE